MVGRAEEIKILNAAKNVQKSAFVAVYGRRRVGKTFLIRHVFEGKFCFQLTGIANVNRKAQLVNFHAALVRYFPGMETITPAEDWFHSFQHLINCLERLEAGKKIIFMDELPWLDTTQSHFIPALEHFWNSWASARKDVLLIVCGSAAAWMVNNLINNKGGLHNRVTHRIRLEPFTLSECETLLKQKSGVLDRYQILQLYMALGGIPFYWEQLDTGMSAAQNINNLFFTQNGLLRTEFDNLYSSLFKKAERHIGVIETLAQKAKGMTRDELLAKARLSNGGNTTRVLKELEESSFIQKYRDFGKNEKNMMYQLTDFYSFFYLKFVKNSDPRDKNIWINSLDNPEHRAWSGYAYEQVCFYHIDQIKKALGISGVHTITSAWRGGIDSTQKAQIDLVIDRRDHVINLCEINYSVKTFTIDKPYADELRNKIGLFRETTGTKKSIFLTMITTYGIESNTHAAALVQNALTMDVLFENA
ncbi:MAG: ATP-binding protein [Bacteroidia bacterium]|nr:ATP-binding protein [Bacteroidia bacterium]